MRHRKPKRRRPCRYVYAALVPLAFAITWQEPVRHVLSGAEQAHRRTAPARDETPPTAPRPRIVPRSAWHADEGLVRERASALKDVRVVFVHHTSQPNGYDCASVPRMLRRLEAEHVERGWDDLGYNFVVDHCGTIYEGRSGALSRSVEGAHTKGFNEDSLGIAALGTFDEGAHVPRPMLKSIAAVAAWKLRPGADARGTASLVSSSGDSRFDKGRHARFHVIAAHRDAYETSCPGTALYAELGQIRAEAERLRERAASRRTDRPRKEADEGNGSDR
ncbi:N-acetylmuramoyl-L-alanine amidase [Streptomyces sp. Amel2xB2]|uniref:N-acetylmuramoyl-L-alanine amidase n=1 Tax=Streptomyces sp. Amel2xB2 TaxID=1305829 RepID=UPI000DB995F1|nr:N-acetylmuramoyl-L-alanine amidase [Streptomyces sp. Amel2xB2]RAJ61623.1 N-acetylmuramoyl-L-alanine amidase [Streptomyces sp. Amel2xB2]